MTIGRLQLLDRESNYCRCFTCHSDEGTLLAYVLVVDGPEGRHMFTTDTVDLAHLVPIASAVFMATKASTATFEERLDCCRVRIIPVDTPGSIALYSEVVSPNVRPLFERRLIDDPERLEALYSDEAQAICRGCLRDGLDELRTSLSDESEDRSDVAASVSPMSSHGARDRGDGSG